MDTAAWCCQQIYVRCDMALSAHLALHTEEYTHWSSARSSGTRVSIPKRCIFANRYRGPMQYIKARQMSTLPWNDCATYFSRRTASSQATRVITLELSTRCCAWNGNGWWRTVTHLCRWISNINIDSNHRIDSSIALYTLLYVSITVAAINSSPHGTPINIMDSAERAHHESEVGGEP